jgi:hypothetical protein
MWPAQIKYRSLETGILPPREKSRPPLPNELIKEIIARLDLQSLSRSAEIGLLSNLYRIVATCLRRQHSFFRIDNIVFQMNLEVQQMNLKVQFDRTNPFELAILELPERTPRVLNLNNHAPDTFQIVDMPEFAVTTPSEQMFVGDFVERTCQEYNPQNILKAVPHEYKKNIMLINNAKLTYDWVVKHNGVVLRYTDELPTQATVQMCAVGGCAYMRLATIMPYTDVFYFSSYNITFSLLSDVFLWGLLKEGSFQARKQSYSDSEAIIVNNGKRVVTQEGLKHLLAHENAYKRDWLHIILRHRIL